MSALDVLTAVLVGSGACLGGFLGSWLIGRPQRRLAQERLEAFREDRRHHREQLVLKTEQLRRDVQRRQEP